MTSTTQPLDLSLWSPSITRYADWIMADHPADAREWEHRINAADPPAVEGAVAEAVAWDYLCNRVDRICRFRPEPGAARSPDFLCTTSSGDVVVEVTNLSRAHVTKLTNLDDPVRPGSGPKNYASWDRHLKSVLSDKAGQGQGLQLPYVVFVTTLHVEASVLLCSRPHVEMVLHSRPHLRGFIDQNGDAVDEVENVTDFATAAFTRKHSVQPARRHVSAMLVGGFGTYPDVRVLGLLHPEAERPLKPGVIASTPLCYWREWPPRGEIKVAWTDAPTPQLAAKRSGLIV
jgi:hypothetical protein